MKTLKVEAVYLNEYETYDDVAVDLPRFIDDVCNAKRRVGDQRQPIFAPEPSISP